MRQPAPQLAVRRPDFSEEKPLACCGQGLFFQSLFMAWP